MKNKILSSVLIFMFAWVAVGALDCGCAFASPAEISAHKKIHTASEGMECHSPEGSNTKQSEETCCTGCQLESKVPTPPNIELSNPIQNKFSFLLSASKLGAFGFIFHVESTQRSTEIASRLVEHARSVPVYNAPIYLAVQSFLI